MTTKKSGNTENDELAMLRSMGNAAVAELFSKYHHSLERMVSFRLNRRLYGRIDPAGILQEAYLEIARRMDDFLMDPKVSFFVWARGITLQTLLLTHRQHLDVQKRDVRPSFAMTVSAWKELALQRTLKTQILMAIPLSSFVQMPSTRTR